MTVHQNPRGMRGIIAVRAEATGDTKKYFEDLNKAFEEFKATNEARLTAVESKGAADPLLDEKLSKLDSDIQAAAEAQTAAISAAQQRVDDVEAAMNRRRLSGGGDDRDIKAAETMRRWNASHGRNNVEVTPEAVSEYRKALDTYLRTPDQRSNRFTTEVYNALSIGSDPDGGYWVTPDVTDTIIGKVFETSPMRELSSVQTIGSKSMTAVVDDDEASSGWLGEAEAPTDTSTPKVREVEIVAFTQFAMPKATTELLDDANIDMQAWLSGKVSNKFAREEATAFVSGNGVGKPRGFTTYAAGTSYGQVEQINLGAAADVTADGLIDLQNSLKEAYQGGATWLVKRGSLSNIRKLKDGNGQYLWQPGLQQGQPPMLLGAAVRMADDMPAISANTLAVAYANFGVGYQIVDRAGIRVVVDNLTSKPHVLFFTTRRVGGAVTVFEAIKLGKIAA